MSTNRRKLQVKSGRNVSRTARKVFAVSVLAGVALAAMAPIIVYAITFFGSLSKDHARWGEFGSYLGGIYGSLALAVLIYTTVSTQRQFSRQSQDATFYRLVDALQDRVRHNSILTDDGEMTAYKALVAIVNKFHKELSQEAIFVARKLLLHPESLADIHFLQLFQVTIGASFIEALESEKEKFIRLIAGLESLSARQEALKTYIGTLGCETEPIKDALRAIGSVNFYKISFKERRNHYRAALERVMGECGQFLDGYLGTLLHIAEVISTSVDRDSYAKYLGSQLTLYETIIIFYLIAGAKENDCHRQKAILDLGLLERIHSSECRILMIDCPGPDVLDQELASIFC